MKTEKTHWLQSPNKNYFGHWDLPESGELIVTIESAKWEEVTNPVNRTKEVKRVVRFQEEGVKPLICNQTNAQSIVTSTGVKFMEDSKGAQICLYLSSVKDRRLGEEVECVRIKRERSITAEDLQVLFLEKQDKIAATQIQPIEKIISDNDTTNYLKVYNYLNKL